MVKTTNRNANIKKYNLTNTFYTSKIREQLSVFIVNNHCLNKPQKIMKLYPKSTAIFNFLIAVTNP